MSNVRKLITAPAHEPVSLSDMKQHLRVDIVEDNDYIATITKLARQFVEKVGRVALITQTWDVYFDCFMGSEIVLPLPPLQSVTGVYYTDEDGNESTFASSNYLVDTVRHPGRIVLKNNVTWPAVTLQEVNGVRVRFVAGYGNTPEAVPVNLVQAVKLLAGDYYENREQSIVAQGLTLLQMPMGVRQLVSLDRGSWF